MHTTLRLEDLRQAMLVVKRKATRGLSRKFVTIRCEGDMTTVSSQRNFVMRTTAHLVSHGGKKIEGATKVALDEFHRLVYNLHKEDPEGYVTLVDKGETMKVENYAVDLELENFQDPQVPIPLVEFDDVGQIPIEMLGRLTKAAEWASKDDARANLKNVNLQKRHAHLGIEDPIEASATNGHFLFTVPLEGVELPNKSLNIPAEALEGMGYAHKKGMVGDRVSFGLTEEGIRLLGNNITIEHQGFGKQGDYPDWRNIVALGDKASFTFNRSRLSRYSKILEAVAGKASGVEFVGRGIEVEMRAGVNTQTPEHGRIKLKGYLVNDKQPEFRVAFNSKYIQKVCDALEGEMITAKVGDKFDPTLWSTGETSEKIVLMPMRM